MGKVIRVDNPKCSSVFGYDDFLKKSKRRVKDKHKERYKTNGDKYKRERNYELNKYLKED